MAVPVFCAIVEVAVIKKGQEKIKDDMLHFPIRNGLYGLKDMRIDEGEPVDPIEDTAHFKVLRFDTEGVTIQHLAEDAGFILVNPSASPEEVVKDQIFTLDGDGRYNLTNGSSYLKFGSASCKVGKDESDEDVEENEDDKKFVEDDKMDSSKLQILLKTAQGEVIKKTWADQQKKDKIAEHAEHVDGEHVEIHAKDLSKHQKAHDMRRTIATLMMQDHAVFEKNFKRNMSEVMSAEDIAEMERLSSLPNKDFYNVHNKEMRKRLRR